MKDTDNGHSSTENIKGATQSASPIVESKSPCVSETVRPNPPSQSGDTPNSDLIMARWTRVVGIFTVVLGIVGVVQAWAFIQSERAFLYFQIQGILPDPLRAEAPISVDFSVTNTGRSQAFIIDEKITLAEYANLPERRPPFLVSKYEAKGPIPAGQKASILMGPLARKFTKNEISAFQSGSLQLFAYGYARYTDEFSLLSSHEVGFCWVYNPVDPTGTPGARFDTCDSPNYVYEK